MIVNRNFPAHPHSFDSIRQMIEDFCSPPGFSPRSVHHITLVLEELFTNTLNHGLDRTEQAEISIILDHRKDRDEIVITFTDQGKPFNPFGEAPRPGIERTLEERDIGGLGVYLVRELSSSTDYRRHGNNNIITCILRTE